MSEDKKISAETLEKIKKFNNALNTKAWLTDGQTVEWHFDPDHIEEVHDDKYDSDKIQFKCYDPELDHEFTWDAPYGAGRQVVAMFAKGHFFLRVHRSGASKDTKYEVTEAK